MISPLQKFIFNFLCIVRANLSKPQLEEECEAEKNQSACTLSAEKARLKSQK